MNHPHGKDFPIVIKQVGNYLILFSPDFDIVIQERIINLSAEELALKVGLNYLNLQRKLEQTIKERIRNNDKLPSPSTVQRAIPTEALLTTTQAALRFGVSKDTVIRMIKRGELKARETPGGHFRVILEA